MLTANMLVECNPLGTGSASLKRIEQRSKRAAKGNRLRSFTESRM